MSYEKKREAGFRPECKCCEESIRDPEQIHRGDEGAFYAGEPLCETCYYEDEICADVLYGNRDPEGVEDPFRTVSLAHNETRGDFEVEWHPTSPWPSRCEVKSNRYLAVPVDSIHNGHSEEDSDRLYDLLLNRLEENGISFVRVFRRTAKSELVSKGIWVRRDPEQLLKTRNILAEVRGEN